MDGKKRQREVPLPLLTILVVGLFGPFFSYLIFLQRLYPASTPLLDLAPVELLVLLALFLLPFRILARLRSGWRRPPEDRDPNGL